METKKITDEKKDFEADAESRLSEEEKEYRLREEAEAKRRAEVAARIKKQAEESARRRAEEDKLWEEAMAKRRAEMERRILEGVETSAPPGLQEANKERSSIAAKRRRREEQRLKKKLEARNLVQKKSKAKPITSNREKREGVEEEHKTNIKNRVLAGSLIALFAILIIWIFSTQNSEAENSTPTLTNTETAAGSGTADSAETKTVPVTENNGFIELKVGDMLEGGIIFSIDHNSKSAKIAHLKDAGPMPWKDAMEIHEQLGQGWRLPSLDELEIMYQTIGPGASNIGEFTNGLYWSATPYDDFQARLLRFWDGNTSFHYNRFVEGRKFSVRAVRDFKP